MGFKVRIKQFGNWDGAAAAINWFSRGFEKALREATKDEAKHITKQIKDNLKKGGSPAFKSISPFTRAIRRAMGVSGKRPGVATRQVLGAISTTKVGKHAYFCGVLKGNDAHVSPGGKVTDVADIALLLEVGRPKIYMELDKAGSTGKTPRQWLWWLYLSGVTKSPPGFSGGVLEINAAPARPFVGQVAVKEQRQIPKRLTERLERRFRQSIASMY